MAACAVIDSTKAMTLIQKKEMNPKNRLLSSSTTRQVRHTLESHPLFDQYCMVLGPTPAPLAKRAGKSRCSVWVNNYNEGDMTVPFGGFKMSGNGRDKSLHAIEKFTETKTTWIRLHP